MRGVLGCFIQFMGGLGILLTFVLGYWANWWQLAAAISSLVLPFALGMVAVPESPHWYLAKGEYSLLPQIDPSVPQPVFTITEKAPTRAFS